MGKVIAVYFIIGLVFSSLMMFVAMKYGRRPIRNVINRYEDDLEEVKCNTVTIKNILAIMFCIMCFFLNWFTWPYMLVNYTVIVIKHFRR